MAKSSTTVDVLNDSTIVFRAKTLTEAMDFNVPIFGLGLLPGAIIALVTLGINVHNLPAAAADGAFLWSLLPFLNVSLVWPMLYQGTMERKLKDRGYTQKVTFLTALKSWYKIPFFGKKKQLTKTYIHLSQGSEHRLQGNIEGLKALMGEATHEVTDYLISDAKGLRLERHVEPTPLMLWSDALKTIDEGFGLKKISA